MGMMDNALLSTKNGRGWVAKRGASVGGAEVLAGEGIVVNDNTVSLSTVPVVPGEYRYPLVTVDEFGRVTNIQPGEAADVLPRTVVDSVDDLASLDEDVLGVIVRDADSGRSAVYIRESGQDWQGPAFITGLAGIQGIQGPEGPQGPQGVQGDIGLTGDNGAKGDQGPQGVTGDEGPQGPQGFQGEQGLQGVDGPEGPEGPMGSFLTPDEYGTLDDDAVLRIQNAGVRWFFLVNPDSDLRTSQLTPTGISGDMSLHLIGYNGTFWTDYGQLTGAQGPRGIQGVAGEQGAQGLQGIQGAAGPAGERGPAGIDGLKGDAGINGKDGVAFVGLSTAAGTSRALSVSDSGRVIRLPTTLTTITVPTPAELGSSFSVELIRNGDDAGGPFASIVIAGKTDFRLYRGESVRVVCDGQDINVIYVSRSNIVSLHARNLPAQNTVDFFGFNSDDFRYIEVNGTNIGQSGSVNIVLQVRIGGAWATSGYRSIPSESGGSQVTSAMFFAEVPGSGSGTRYSVRMKIEPGLGLCISDVVGVSSAYVRKSGGHLPAGSFDGIRIAPSPFGGATVFNSGSIRILGFR